MAAKLRRVLAAAGLLGTAAGLTYTALAVAGMRRFRRSLDGPRADFTMPATILKPLHGYEPELYQNLRSFCEQAYPYYQVIFGAADGDDPALSVAREIRRELPHCEIEIVCGHARRARNPKVGNLLAMIARARHPLILIADSDIRVGRQYLQTVAARFADAHVGAATCLYGGKAAGTLASRLGAMFVNDHFSPSVLVAQTMEPLTYCFGATMAVRRDVLEEIGGLEALADHLGDDYRLGNLVARAGYRVELVPYVVHAQVVEGDLRSLWERELRWARTIRSARPAGYAASVVSHPLPFALLFAATCTSRIAGVGVLALASCARLLLHRIADETFGPSQGAGVWLIPVRDVLSLGVWGASFLGRGVVWKRGRFAVAADGRMVGPPG